MTQYIPYLPAADEEEAMASGATRWSAKAPASMGRPDEMTNSGIEFLQVWLQLAELSARPKSISGISADWPEVAHQRALGAGVRDCASDGVRNNATEWGGYPLVDSYRAIARAVTLACTHSGKRIWRCRVVAGSTRLSASPEDISQHHAGSGPSCPRNARPVAPVPRPWKLVRARNDN